MLSLAQRFAELGVPDYGSKVGEDYSEAGYTAMLGSVNLWANAQIVAAAVDRTQVVLGENERNPVVLTSMAVPPVPNIAPSMIGPQTIIPGIGLAAMEFSVVPEPSILPWAMVANGLLSFFWNGIKVGMIVADLQEHQSFSRMGQRLDAHFKMRFDTNRGEGRGRYVHVRGADGAVAGDKGGYNAPSQWWEFWKRIN